MTRIILDTGPIVAFLNKRDRYFTWVSEAFNLLEPPVYTCESVISEACFLLRNMEGGSIAVAELIARRLVVIDFDLSGEIQAVKKLMSKYANVPMSLADACLIRMTEIEKNSQIVTFDQDFNVYRRFDRQLVPVLMP